MSGRIYIPHSDEWVHDALRVHQEIDSAYGEGENSQIQIHCLERSDLRQTIAQAQGVGVFSVEYMRIQRHYVWSNVLSSDGHLIRRHVPAGFSGLSSIWMLQEGEPFTRIASHVEARLRQMSAPEFSARSGVSWLKVES